jgi:hypothetical protein
MKDNKEIEKIVYLKTLNLFLESMEGGVFKPWIDEDVLLITLSAMSEWCNSVKSKRLTCMEEWDKAIEEGVGIAMELEIIKKKIEKDADEIKNILTGSKLYNEISIAINKVLLEGLVRSFIEVIEE